MFQIKKIVKKVIGGEHSILLIFYHFLKAVIASLIFGFPTRGKLVIGVTGTDGKTTTITLLASILEQAGYKVGLATTVEFRDGTNKFLNKSKKTSLSPRDLNKFLHKIKDKVNIVLVEVSSHSLDQNRLWGIRFKYGIITNLTREHLDYHGTMEKYAKAKAKIIDIIQKNGGKIVLNHDNERFNYFHKKATNLGIYFSKYQENHYLYTIKQDKNNFILQSNEFQDLNDKKIYTDLLGDYNLENILGAILLAKLIDVDFKHIYNGIKAFTGVPGRLELFTHKDKPKVIVDYAVTPDSLQKLYENIKENFKYNNLIAVFGSCGDRDRGKRPIMAKIVDSCTDYIVLTNEDPYTEDPHRILDEIEKGVLTKNLADENHSFPEGSYFKIIDRRQAIDFAINKLGKEGDLVVITGKGAETGIMIGTEILPFNERKIVQEMLRK